MEPSLQEQPLFPAVKGGQRPPTGGWAWVVDQETGHPRAAVRIHVFVCLPPLWLFSDAVAVALADVRRSHGEGTRRRTRHHLRAIVALGKGLEPLCAFGADASDEFRFGKGEGVLGRGLVALAEA